MEHQGKRSCRRTEDDSMSKLEDRLSSLPDPILVDILSLLPLKSAVACAALSRRWRTVWTQLTALRHDGLVSPWSINTFSSSIFQICGNHVRMIDISFCPAGYFNLISLPSCVFECQSLETLMLGEGFDFELPHNGIRLPNLRILHVWVCDRNVEFMVNVFKSCPLLENLHLAGNLVDYQHSVDITCSNLKWLRSSMFCFDRDKRVVINAPKLEALHIDDDSTQYCFPKAPTNLVEAELWGLKGEETWELELLESINGVRSLTLFGYVFVDSWEMVDGVVPIFFYGLTNFTASLTSSHGWKGLMRFLGQCPSLQVLNIRRARINGWSGMNLPDFDCLPTCLSTNVKWLKLEFVEEEKHELEITSFILNIAKVLETLDVILARDASTDKEMKLPKEFDFCQELCNFPRSSPTCQINFYGQYYQASSKGMKV